MSTYKATHQKKEVIFYAAVTISSLIIGTVYEFFSHQVYSPFMYLLFLIPLLLGLTPNLLAQKLHKYFLSSENAKAAYKMGVLTLIFGSFLKGVFDIYGTHSVYPSFYLPVGLLLLLVALGFEIHQRKGMTK
ncbi:hypothetical protein [Abiotrophia sp.]|uniref:hypothetical protein n=1 Tax=Abiotrophia sp. TaxID=76631 RepID=UPI001CAB81FE|nr:hypothetical protein [Abiotrophia sp.]MBF0941914.1 hypothetical protein [Abiotrophia sp.]